MTELVYNNYTILKILGEGAYAKVYKAKDRDDNIVAIKIYSKKDNKYAEKEYTIMKDLCHENIISVVDLVYCKKNICIVYELCKYDLGDIIYRKKYTLKYVKNIFSQLLKALLYIHRHGIIHNDIKPENILLINGIVKLADFNHAKYIFSNNTGIYATRYYRSPEMILGMHLTHLSDIWSAGCVLYEMITGEELFQPVACKKRGITRSESHIALMHQKCGDFPDYMTDLGYGKYAGRIFKNRKLRNIKILKFDREFSLLDKFVKSQVELNNLKDLLKKLLTVDVCKRISSFDALKHPFLMSP